ncbi:MAG: aminotransferase class V-fold PLP-dependent enzyme [Bacteriovoracia bacterium]
MGDFSSLFTQDREIFFLNAGTQSRTPLAVLDWMRSARDRSEMNPTKAMVQSFPALWEVQKRLAVFLGAEPADLFLRANVTAAFNDFLFALPMAAGAEILTNDHEYGAISNLARWRAQQERLGFRSFALPMHPAGDDAVVAACLAALKPETKVFLISHVATGTGAVLPIAKIAESLRERGIAVLVDGAHAVGALPLALRELGAVDFYGGNFHKWFLGPAGTGFGWVNPRWRGKLEWKFGGWGSFGIPPSYGTFGEGDAEAALRLMPGTIDPIPFLALGTVLDFWQEKGAEKIRAQQRKWRDLAASLAETQGWVRACPSEPGRMGPLVSFARPVGWGDGPAIELATRIYRECNVQLALPQVGNKPLVRLSPGVYSRENEVEEGMSRLMKFSV